MVGKANKKKIEERRGAVRANRVVAIGHRIFRRASEKKAEEAWSLSTTKNMSVSGLLFLSAIPYKMGDIVEISVTMSGVIDIFQGFGEVVRIIEKSGRSCEVAVRFVELKSRPRSAKSHLNK